MEKYTNGPSMSPSLSVNDTLHTRTWQLAAESNEQIDRRKSSIMDGWKTKLSRLIVIFLLHRNLNSNLSLSVKTDGLLCSYLFLLIPIGSLQYQNFANNIYCKFRMNKAEFDV